MNFFIFLLVYFLIRGGTPKDQRRSDLSKGIFGLLFAVFILSNILPVLTGLGGVALVGFGIYWLVRKLQQKQRQEENRRQQEYNDLHGYQEPSESYREAARDSMNRSGQSAAHRTSSYSSARYSSDSAKYNPDTSYGKTSSYSGSAYKPYTAQDAGTYTSTPTQTKSRILPQRSKKRYKILRDFNAKNDLNLTEEQMQSIVNSSYMSETWKRELESMTVRYDSIYEWFQGETRYLRAYLYAFRVQEITSDIYQQEQICMHAFEQVWSYADSFSYLSLEERIQKVNETYYTQFDNITFMIAYRFLEARGRKHKLDTLDPVQSGDDMEDLKKKYDTLFGEEEDAMPKGQTSSH